MSLHLIEIKGNKPADTGYKPDAWTARYLVCSSPGPGSARSAGKSYWFEIEVAQDSQGKFTAKLAMGDIPEQPSFAAALGKLTEWAMQVAAGIMECGNLPTDGFPLEIGHGKATRKAKDWSPARRRRESPCDPCARAHH